MEKSLNSVYNISLNNVPKFLKEEGWKTIRSGCFVRAKLEDSVFNLSRCNGSIQEASMLIRERRNGQGLKIMNNIKQVGLIIVTKTIFEMPDQNTFNVHQIISDFSIRIFDL